MVIAFLEALALLLVFEGLMPFSSPVKWKQMLRKFIGLDEKVLRITGFISMSVGVILLTIVHQFAE
ncbi:DUF2065 domain-containing protein [Legionella jordanis]|uniref:DUF2065 domain-containing protein n=1 Tax=Legionella jordanis TaxID=456 RepID=A0A0W0VB61_9GAMM|nr:DUF2065 domain-containing protein [Legionella jordanis]KTD17349.1 hypothetical protein Ljor_1655 [Legionella jordanis]RMX01883.1 DUF2065 domain-containing protein [Legionella jordanis]RMX17673.1 DUF2065 domain-containing protein [Legionella jordanis]VEH11634.1 Uncharacterized protein conserved in bacteria (DUF2065) [Legionella jordanis]